MRSVLALAVCLLALVFALEREDELRLDRPARGAGADRALEIIVGAKGPLLPAARLGTGPERIGEAIRLDSRTLVANPSAPSAFAGLRSALLARDGFLESQRGYAVGRSGEDLRALASRVERADVGSVLVLASSGRLEPEGPAAEELRAELDAVLALLGARARPGRRTPESWALIALRLEERWLPLAEGYSRDSGVVLSFVLSGEHERYEDFRGDYVETSAPSQSEVFLEEELSCADEREETTALVRDRTVAGVPLAAILQPPGEAAAGAPRKSALVWRDVPIGPGAGFLSWVGLADGESEGSDGVAFELRVEGELLLSLPAQPGARWRAFQVDLRPYAGRAVDIELGVDPLASTQGDRALWGRPMLVRGYDRSPLEAWAEGR